MQLAEIDRLDEQVVMVAAGGNRALAHFSSATSVVSEQEIAVSPGPGKVMGDLAANDYGVLRNGFSDAPAKRFNAAWVFAEADEAATRASSRSTSKVRIEALFAICRTEL